MQRHRKCKIFLPLQITHIMMRLASLLQLGFAIAAEAFPLLPLATPFIDRPWASLPLQAVAERRMGDLTKPEQTVFDLLQEVSLSGFSFRVVVVGKGAILESTVPSLGPVVKVTQSPSTGEGTSFIATRSSI
jgi:hypothetical protein